MLLFNCNQKNERVAIVKLDDLLELMADDMLIGIKTDGSFYFNQFGRKKDLLTSINGLGGNPREFLVTDIYYALVDEDFGYEIWIECRAD